MGLRGALLAVIFALSVALVPVQASGPGYTCGTLLGQPGLVNEGTLSPARPNALFLDERAYAGKAYALATVGGPAAIAIYTGAWQGWGNLWKCYGEECMLEGGAAVAGAAACTVDPSLGPGFVRRYIEVRSPAASSGEVDFALVATGS